MYVILGKLKIYDVRPHVGPLDNPSACWLVDIRHSREKKLWPPNPQQTSNFQHLVYRLQFYSDNRHKWTHFSTKRHVQIPVACAILTNETLARQIVQHPAQTQEPRSLHAISMGAGPEKCMVARLKISRKSLTELVNQLSSWYVFNRLFQKCHIKYTIK